MKTTTPNTEIWTIGHSTRSSEEFMEILRSFQIEMLVDVRRYPGSRRYPFYNKEKLQAALPEGGIEYLHLEDLGGRRKAEKESRNSAWRLLSFRGYADYMATDTFKTAAETLQESGKQKRIAYMCAEAVWWSCHRALISDYLKVRGWKVTHIMGPAKGMEHPYTKPARIIDNQLSYEKE